MGATGHVYDIFGEIVTDHYIIVRVLQYPYEIPLIVFVITTCLYEFIRVVHDQSPVFTI